MRSARTLCRPGLTDVARPGAACGRRFTPLASTAAASTSSPNPLAPAVDLARARSTHPSLCPVDPYADLLIKAANCDQEEEEDGSDPPSAPSSTSPPPSALDAAATAWIDTHALRAVGLVNLDVRAAGEEYRQILLLSPGLDTRPFRLPWPQDGPLQFFEVAPADCLAVAAAALKTAGVGVPRGCLLRRVVGDIAAGDDAWVDRLTGDGAGFRGDRLSVVCLQAGTVRWGGGEGESGLTRPALRTALAAAARVAARGSFAFGDLPGWVASRSEAADLLAEAGWMAGALERPGDSEESGAAGWSGGGSDCGRWFFAAQQQGRSDAELDILDRAEWEVDEDFDGHFS